MEERWMTFCSKTAGRKFSNAKLRLNLSQGNNAIETCNMNLDLYGQRSGSYRVQCISLCGGLYELQLQVN